MQNISDPLSTGVQAETGGSRRLVVLVPGMNSDTSKWQSLLERLQQEPGYRPSDDADWLPFDHGINFTSWGRLNDLAHRLRSRIDGEWQQHGGYRDIVFIAHSFAGLLVRQVYLLAMGAVPYEHGSVWGGRVSRMVLFAAVNRGFNLDRLHPFVGLVTWLARGLSKRIFTFEDVLKGSDFVTNLRIDWIRHFRTMEDQMLEAGPETVRFPLVVQLLGDEDGEVSRDDSKDLLGFPNSHYIEVADANHANLYRLDLAPDPEARYAVLRKAFLAQPADMITDSTVRPSELPVRRVVMLLHGIRASSVDAWIDGLRSKLMAQDTLETKVVSPTYGYFSALRFAIPQVRRKNIPIFRDLYTELLAMHPRAEFDIIAHSNGTYMLGHSLSRTPGMRFQNVVLAGSALPPSYDWGRLMNPVDGNSRQVGRVMNERASHDWPVAWLCSALRGLGMRDVGPAGFSGFLGSEVIEVAYHEGDHGGALKPQNHDRLISFALGGAPPEPPHLIEEPYRFGLVSRLAPYIIWLLVLGIVSLIVLFIFKDWTLGRWGTIGALAVLVIILMALDTA